MTKTTELSRVEWPPRRLLDWLRFPEWAGPWEGPEMKVEEFVDGGELVVRAEMPGLDPDKDVDIHVTDHTLRIRAERRQESKVEEKDGYRSEFHYGSFTRTRPLPAGASETDVKATYRDGILEIRLPVDKKAAESTKIPVQRV